MRILMTGGGTGGHINPALAIADTFKKQDPEAEIAFVGTPSGMENRLVPKAGYPLYTIDIRGLRRSLSLSNLKTLKLAFSSVREAKALIREFKPDLAVGTGGYVSWPLIRAASELGIPTALHESNAIPGVSVKLLSPRVDIIFVNFDSTASSLPRARRVLRSGNPMRSDFSNLTKEGSREKLGFNGKYRFSILSCGGSLGASAINSSVLDMMENYSSLHPEIHHLHQAGVKNYPSLLEEFRSRGLDKFPNLSLVDYIYDMPYRLSAADVVINRAGAMTISELALLGKASILIPSPNVTDNHQFKNAKLLSDSGAALLLEESSLTGDSLASSVDSLLSSRSLRSSLESSIAPFALPGANIFIYNELKALVNRAKV